MWWHSINATTFFCNDILFALVNKSSDHTFCDLPH